MRVIVANSNIKIHKIPCLVNSFPALFAFFKNRRFFITFAKEEWLLII